MTFLKHLAGYLPVNIALAAASFGGVYVFTRLLGPEDYGLYALAMWAMVVLHTGAITWAEAANYRFAAEAEAAGQTADHYAAAIHFVSRAVLVSIFIAGVFWFMLRDQPRYAALVPLIALLVPVNAIIKVALEAHRAGQRVGRYVQTEVFRTLAGFAIGTFLAWKTGAGAASPLIGLALAGGVMAAREGVFLWSQAKGGSVKPDTLLKWTAYGLPVSAALVLDVVLSGIDRPMIAYFLGEAAVGQYVAGYGVADKTVLLICSWATMAASPLLLAAYEKGGREAAEREAAHLARTLLLLAMPAAAGLALVARPLGEIMVGEALREQATRIMPWIAFAGLLNGFLVQYIGEAFNIIKRTADRALLMLVPVCVNVILNLILLPRIGLMGAVYATLIAYAAGIIVLGLAVRRHLRLPVPLNDLVRISLATLAMAGAVSLLPDLGGWPELMLKGLTGAGVYAMAVYALNAGGARDLIATRGRIQNTE